MPYPERINKDSSRSYEEYEQGGGGYQVRGPRHARDHLHKVTKGTKVGRIQIQTPADAADGLDWQEQAACREYDNILFFGPDQPESELEKQAREAEAKAVCRTCPVIEPCLEFAMETNQKYGIWGGLTDKERASLKRRRARARRAS